MQFAGSASASTTSSSSDPGNMTVSNKRWRYAAAPLGTRHIGSVPSASEGAMTVRTSRGVSIARRVSPGTRLGLLNPAVASKHFQPAPGRHSVDLEEVGDGPTGEEEWALS